MWRWKVLEKIISHGKKKDSSQAGQENITSSIPNSSLYEVKIKKIKTVTIKTKKDENRN